MTNFFRVVATLVAMLIIGGCMDLGLRLVERLTAGSVLLGVPLIVGASVCEFIALITWCDSTRRRSASRASFGVS